MGLGNWEEGLARRSTFPNLGNPSDPALGSRRQPKHMNDYLDLPVDKRNDYGGVHINSGIPNYCTYLILTAADNAGKQIFTADECAQLFYISLTARLNRLADFMSNKDALINSATSLFRNAPERGAAQVAAVTKAFKDVGL